jgi:hypothetical protein
LPAIRLDTPRIAWCLATLILLIVAVSASKPVLELLGIRTAVWLSVSLPAERATDLYVSVSATEGDVSLPVHWEAKGFNEFLYLSPEAPVRIHGLAIDGASLVPGQVSLDRRWPRANAWPIRIERAGLLKAPAGKQIALTLEADKPTQVLLRWRQLDRIVILDPGRTEVIRLDTNGQAEGWILLPPWSIKSLALHWLSDQAPKLNVRLHTNAANPVTLTPSTCAHREEGAPQRGCVSELSGFPRSEPIWPLQGLIIVILVGIGIACLASIRWIARGIGEFRTTLLTRVEFKEPPRALSFLIPRLEHWQILIVVGALSLAYHAMVLTLVPLDYSPDSLTYYGAGKALALGIGFDAIYSARPPGYPGFIAATILLFGDQIFFICLLQHLALAILGPAVAHVLNGRIGPRSALVFGALAGANPWLAVTANLIWSEALFACFITLAALVFACRTGLASIGLPRTVLGAFLLGIAINMRPSGMILLAVVLAALALEWWIGPRSMNLLKAVSLRSCLILGAALAVVGPWMLHLYKREGSFPAISVYSGSADRTQILTPTSMNLIAWYFPFFYQNRLTADLPIQAPMRAFTSGWSIESDFHFADAMPPETYYDARYPGEAVRQSLRLNLAAHLRAVTEAAYFNAGFRRFSGSQQVVWSDIAGMVELMLRTRPDHVVQLAADHIALINADAISAAPPNRIWTAQRAERIEQFLRAKTESTRPPDSNAMTRRALAPSFFVKKYYLVLTGLAFLSIAAIAFYPPARGLGIVWAAAFGNLSYLSIMGFANDRYVATFEPALFILAAFLLPMLAVRIKRKAHRPEV